MYKVEIAMTVITYAVSYKDDIISFALSSNEYIITK